MKKKISISIDEETLRKLDALVLNPTFRNKSHIVELALNKFSEDEK